MCQSPISSSTFLGDYPHSNAKQISGVEFLVGFETEFILLKSTNPIEPVNAHGWSNSPALASGTKEAQVLDEIAIALRASRIGLQMYHAEAAPGQYEVVTAPLPPLQAVDALIHTRETIYNIASKHGLRATLAPRVFLDNSTSFFLFFFLYSFQVQQLSTFFFLSSR